VRAEVDADAWTLEVLDTGDGPFVAIQWRRVLPKSLAKNHKLIAFGR
jgi:hypothetical protein